MEDILGELSRQSHHNLVVREKNQFNTPHIQSTINIVPLLLHLAL